MGSIYKHNIELLEKEIIKLKEEKKQIIDTIYSWYMEILTELKGTKIAYGIITKINSLKEKLEELKNG